MLAGGAHLSDHWAPAVLSLHWGQRSPGALGTLANLESLVYPQGLEGQNLEDPPPRPHLSPPKNLNRKTVTSQSGDYGRYILVETYFSKEKKKEFIVIDSILF